MVRVTITDTETGEVQTLSGLSAVVVTHDGDELAVASVGGDDGACDLLRAATGHAESLAGGN